MHLFGLTSPYFYARSSIVISGDRINMAAVKAAHTELVEIANQAAYRGRVPAKQTDASLAAPEAA